MILHLDFTCARDFMLKFEILSNNLDELKYRLIKKIINMCNNFLCAVRLSLLVESQTGYQYIRPVLARLNMQFTDLI